MSATDVRIRDAKPEDAMAVQAIYAPWVTETAVSFELVPPTAPEMAARMARATDRHPWLVAEDAEGVLGYAYATAFRARPAYAGTVETSVYVAPRARRQGVATRLMEALLARCKAAGAEQVIACATMPNEPSEALHHALGFKTVGTFEGVGRKFDQTWSVRFWQREA